MMHRDGWDGNRISNPTAFAWYIWERGYIGKPELHRTWWKPGAEIQARLRKVVGTRP